MPYSFTKEDYEFAEVRKGGKQMIQLINDDCRNVMGGVIQSHSNIIVVTDPPFNIGYKYNSYSDKVGENEYIDLLKTAIQGKPFVMVHYPEQMYAIASALGVIPTKVVSWVYNSNTAKQHRDIAFFGVKPNMANVRQPYKNPNDKRIQERIKRGCKGAKLYDWWNINQVKNVSKEKTSHPCQMPLEVMERVIGILPKDAVIVDPFMGSGTTGVACRKLGRDFIGIEMDREYYDIATKRIMATPKDTDEMKEKSMICPVCKQRRIAERHHIIHGSTYNRKLSEQYDKACMVNLCRECHYEVHHGTGENLDWKLKQQAQQDFELFYPDEDWFKVFGRNYI